MQKKKWKFRTWRYSFLIDSYVNMQRLFLEERERTQYRVKEFGNAGY